MRHSKVTVFAIATLASAISFSAQASDCPFAKTTEIIRLKELMGTAVSNADKIDWIDKDMAKIQREMKKRTLLEKPMTKAEVAGCREDITELKSVRATLVAERASESASTSSRSSDQGPTWQVGDKAYLWNAWNGTQRKNEFALVEIDDVRGDRVKVIARAACNDNGWAGKGCKTGWFISSACMQLNDSRWIRKQELLTSWEEKVIGPSGSC